MGRLNAGLHLRVEPSGAPCIPAGQIAERTDARGVTVGYYDGSTFTAKYPSSLDPPTQVVPTDRVGYVVYEYDAAGQLSKITAKSGPGSDGVIVTENKFDHDEHGNLTAEWQQRGQAVGTGSPKIDYLWSYAPTGTTPDAIGRTRLTKMTYPAQCGQTRREVSLGYGTGADDLLSRIASLTTNLGAPTTIGQFTWMGTGRRSSTTLGGGAIVQDAHLGSEVGLAGLDSFGRTIDLHYRDGASTSDSTLFRGRYAYDASGNRTAARITQAASPSDNLRSQLNTYNGLDQLTGSTVGTLNSDNTALETGTSPRRTDAWNLDVLGNWNGNGKLDAGNNALPGRATSTYLDGPAGTRLLFDASDNQNRVDNRTVDTGSSGGPTTTHYAYDASGNLLCDGVYYYQYDAWNRLVQVNQAAQQTLTGGQTVLASDGVTQLSYIWAPVSKITTARGPTTTSISRAILGSLEILSVWSRGIRSTWSTTTQLNTSRRAPPLSTMPTPEPRRPSPSPQTSSHSSP